MRDAANPEPGWYVAYTSDGAAKAVEIQTMPGHRPFYCSVRWNDYSLPSGWTLGQRIEDLLRDAEKWRIGPASITMPLAEDDE